MNYLHWHWTVDWDVDGVVHGLLDWVRFRDVDWDLDDFLHWVVDVLHDRVRLWVWDLDGHVDRLVDRDVDVLLHWVRNGDLLDEGDGLLVVVVDVVVIVAAEVPSAVILVPVEAFAVDSAFVLLLLGAALRLDRLLLGFLFRLLLADGGAHREQDDPRNNQLKSK